MVGLLTRESEDLNTRLLMIKSFLLLMRKRRVRLVLAGFFLLWWVVLRRAEHKAPPPEFPPQTKAYIQRFGALATRLSAETGVPAAIMLAAGGLESGWGSSELSKKGHNHFGIKADGAGAPRYCLYTKEFRNNKAQMEHACFRAYARSTDSFRDYCQTLRGDERYARLFKKDPDDYKGWARGLEKYGYATDPEYAEKLIRLIKLYRLHTIDTTALNTPM